MFFMFLQKFIEFVPSIEGLYFKRSSSPPKMFNSAKISRVFHDLEVQVSQDNRKSFITKKLKLPKEVQVSRDGL